MRGGKIEDLLITGKEERSMPTQRQLNQKLMAAFFAMGGEDTRPD